MAVLMGGVVWLATRLALQGLAGTLVALGAVGVAFMVLRQVRRDALREAGELVARAGEMPAASGFGQPTESEGFAAVVRVSVARHEEQLSQARGETAYFRRLAEDTRGLEAFFGVSGKLEWVSPSVAELTGYSLQESFAAADPVELWVYVKDRATVREFMQRARAGEIRENIEIRIQRKDGSQYWCACVWHPYYGSGGELIGLRFSGLDVEARKQAELRLLESVAALRRTQALKEYYLHRSDDERMRLSALLDVVNLGILFVGRDRRVVYVNQPAVDMWSLGERNAIEGMRDAALVDMTARLRVDDDAYRAHVLEVFGQRRNSAPYEVRLKDGRVIRELSARVLSAQGDRVIGRVWIHEDVTEALQTRNRLVELAERDPLTGLFNRRRFHEELQRQLAEANRSGEQLGLLSIDLDGFKAVNDTLGHLVGDEVLIRIAREIASVVRRNELFFRLGGDEFAILMARASMDNTTHLARRIVERAAALPLQFQGTDVRITLSVGISLSPTHSNNPEGLVMAADRAMYQAKARGKNQWALAEVAPPEVEGSAPDTLSQPTTE